MSNDVTVKDDAVGGIQVAEATPLERLVVGILESLDGCFSTMASSDNVEQHKTTTMTLSSKLLTMPTQTNVDHVNKALLSMLFPNRAAFFNHKVKKLLPSTMIRTFKLE